MEFIDSSSGTAALDPAETSPRSLKWQVGADTDIGGGRENQDDFFIWQRQSEGVCILGVLDGHGRDVGKLAAQSGKRFLLEFFDQYYSKISANPLETLSEALRLCHLEIKRSFQEELTKGGYEVCEAPEGYLLKRRGASSQAWLCVHGGTSCSITAIIGKMLYTANVGDSSGILCANIPVLCASQLVHVGDAAVITAPPPSPMDGDSPTDTITITAEHSPESFSEYDRMRKFRCSDDDSSLPALHVVYDTPGQEKIKCPPCFAADANGSLVLTNRGAYYKNVRKEW